MATDYTRAIVAASLANQPLLLPSGLPSVPLYVALGNGSNGGRGHQATDIGLFAEVYGTRLRYSYDSVYQAYTAQITRNYTVSQPTGTFTECAVFDQDVTQTTLTAAVSAAGTTVPVSVGAVVQGADSWKTAAPTSLSGTTAGSVQWSMPEQGAGYKKLVGALVGYENTGSTAQTITFPTAFANPPTITSQPSGFGATATTTTLTLPTGMSEAVNGVVVVEGI